MTSEQKQRLLKAKVAVPLQHETVHVPTRRQVEELRLLARVLCDEVEENHGTTSGHRVRPPRLE